MDCDYKVGDIYKACIPKIELKPIPFDEKNLFSKEDTEFVYEDWVIVEVLENELKCERNGKQRMFPKIPKFFKR